MSGFQSLTNASTGTGVAQDNGFARANHSLIVASGAGVSGGVVTLQGSNDNVNWFTTTVTATTSAANTVYGANLVGFPFQFVRAAITTGITGGTVSASVASA